MPTQQGWEFEVGDGGSPEVYTPLEGLFALGESDLAPLTTGCVL